MTGIRLHIELKYNRYTVIKDPSECFAYIRNWLNLSLILTLTWKNDIRSLILMKSQILILACKPLLKIPWISLLYLSKGFIQYSGGLSKSKDQRNQRSRWIIGESIYLYTDICVYIYLGGT